MCRYNFTLVLLVLLCTQVQVLGLVSVGKKMPVKPCPCQAQKQCFRITDTKRKEVFAFTTVNDANIWSKFDWSKLTTVVSVGYVNDSLTCLAHSHNTRVVYLADLSSVDFTDASSREKWIAEQLVMINNHFLDGINFDYEDVIAKDDEALCNGYTRLVTEANLALKRMFPYSQVSVDVGWNPYADIRYYDYVSLANGSDFLFVMAYQEQSQIHGECLALPNSGIHQTMAGLKMYVMPPLSIGQDKLVLGLPWYGLLYRCLSLEKSKCHIKPEPYLGVNCSDLPAGKGIGYGQIYSKFIQSMPDQVKWNSTSLTPFITFKDTTETWQLQYDDPISLSIKYQMAEELGLHGVGMWTVDSLDFSDTEAGRVNRREMFGTLPSYK